MSDVANAADVPATAPKRDRSPSFPYIGLLRAVERTRELFNAAKRHEVRLAEAARTWGLGPKSSSTLQTAAALIAYGLIEDSGSGENRKVRVSDFGWRLLEDERPSVKDTALAEAALKPRLIAEFAERWKDGRPDDAICKSQLTFEHHFTQDAAGKFLRVYDETVQFTETRITDRKPDRAESKKPRAGDISPEGSDRTPRAKAGDYVQWTNSGMEMFVVPARVAWVAEDGAWLRVEGNETRIPMNEVRVLPPPAPEGASIQSKSENQIQVLLDGNRLRITASVDVKGLKRLKRIIEANESLLESDSDA